MKSAGMALFLAVGTLCVADTPFSGPGTFPQFRDMSGLPGGLFGVDVHGRPTITGALAISTPIGFGLGPYRGALGLASRSRNGSLQPINVFRRSSPFESDGTGQVMLAVPTPAGNLTGSMMVLSTLLDTVFNFQLQLPLRSDRYGISLGVQNFHDDPKASGENQPGEGDLSRSFFVAGTYQVAPGAYVTLGKGDVRFQGVFGSACFQPLPRTKLVAEYERFGWNSGVAYSLGRVSQIGGAFRDNEMTLFLGYIQGRRALVALNFAF